MQGKSFSPQNFPPGFLKQKKYWYLSISEYQYPYGIQVWEFFTKPNFGSSNLGYLGSGVVVFRGRGPKFAT